MRSQSNPRLQLDALEALRTASSVDALITEAANVFAGATGAAEVEVTHAGRTIRSASGVSVGPDAMTIDLPFRRIDAAGRVRCARERADGDDELIATVLALHVVLALENLVLSEAAEIAAAGRRDLTSVVSHDLRAPLQTFTLGLGLVEQLIDPRGKDVVLRMRRNVSAMERLIRDIVEVSRLEQEGCTLTVVSVDPSRLVSDIVDELTPQVEVDSITLEARFETSPDRRLRGDMSRLRQAVTNLATHAIKNTPKGGRVTITSRDVPGGVRFDVEDNGKPLPHDVLERAFEPLVRGPDGKMKGIGLGLFIARRIAEAHGGDVGAEAPPAGGSRFWVSIPLVTQGAGAAVSASPPSA